MKDDEPYTERRYRGVMEPAGLTCYRVAEGESDLYVCTKGDLKAQAAGSLSRHRAGLEAYLLAHPSFGTSFTPLPAASGAPGIVRDMAEAAERFGVGPMAAVAGAIADHVGRDLLGRSGEVIVENGGDLFLAGGRKRVIRVFAGEGRPTLHLVVEDTPEGVGLCTSSAGVGPSVSLGIADAVTVLAGTAALADAAATALGNMVGSRDDVGKVLEIAARFGDVMGVVLVVGEVLGARGELEIA